MYPPERKEKTATGVGPERPQDREPGPGDEETEHGQAGKDEQRGARAATQEPDPHCREKQVDDRHRRTAPEDVSTGKEGEDRDGDGCDRKGQQVQRPARRP